MSQLPVNGHLTPLQEALNSPPQNLIKNEQLLKILAMSADADADTYVFVHIDVSI